MLRYKNLSGNSNVSGYRIDGESVTVQFNDGSMYVYDYRATGAGNVEHMKRLAANGQGLNSFINLHVRKRYAAKVR